MSTAAAEMVRLAAGTVHPLLAMLRAIETAGEAQWFRPHPFTIDHLSGLLDPSARDLYYVLVVDGVVLAYGLLRGWDEGYEVPSLGIAVHPDHRGLGLGTTVMHFLHSAARLRASPRVRLRVSRSNAVATALYQAMGYRFEDPATDAGDDPLLTGYKELERR